ncbi:MAG TPA: hypothetical protein PK760_09745, partial [Flavobacteriales bacterium]|nr:hypothetical protein [Flavobacteriales bacterium]
MRSVRNVLRFIGASAFWFVFISVSWVALLGIFDAPVTWVMVDQANELGGIERTNRSLDEIARCMPLAVISSEDQRFMTHHG